MTLTSQQLDSVTTLATVPRHLVHREAVSEVFVTDCKAAGSDIFVVGAHLPNNHFYYNDLPDRVHDVMLFIEASRQACIYISHTYYGVPDGWNFVFREANVEIIDMDGLSREPGQNFPLVLDIDLHTIFKQERQVTGSKITVGAYIAGRKVATMSGSFSFVPSEDYKMFRQAVRRNLAPSAPIAATTPISPAQRVGRANDQNVFVGRGENDELQLIDRSGHPSLGDHWVDHVSGMVMIEAMRQAAIFADGKNRSNMKHFRVKFNSFVESDRPTKLTCIERDGVYLVELIQDGVAAATSEVAFR